MFSVLFCMILGKFFLFGPCAGADMPPFYEDKTDLMVYLDAKGANKKIQSVRDWQQRRGHILANLQLVMGRLPDSSRKVPLKVEVMEEVELAGVKRQKITFSVEKEDRVPAYLLFPRHKRKGRTPALLCLHQTARLGKGEPAGVGGRRHLHYALELAERGYITLAPDYPNFGEYSYDPYSRNYASTTMKGIWNHMRAVDLLQLLPQVDPNRIGCIGHSLGGHNALFLAGFDTRIKVVVTSCGFTSFSRYKGGDLTGWSHKGYMPRIANVYGNDPKKMPFDFSEILGVLAPRAVFINAPIHDDNFDVTGVKDCLRSALPVYELLGGKDTLVAVHPDCGHDFPPAIRQQAYEFIDKIFKNQVYGN